MGVFLDPLPPVPLGDLHPIEDGLRAQEPRGDCHGGHPAEAGLLELLGEPIREPHHRDLDKVVEKVAPIAEVVPVSDLYHEPLLPADHQRKRVPARDDVGVYPSLEHEEALGKIQLPGKLPPRGQGVTSPNIVDENVQPPVLLPPDPLEQSPDLFRSGVVDPDGDATPAPFGDKTRSLLDRLLSPQSGRMTLDAAAGAIDRRSALAERDGDAATGPSRGPRHESDLPLQGWGPFRSHHRTGDRTVSKTLSLTESLAL